MSVAIISFPGQVLSPKAETNAICAHCARLFRQLKNISRESFVGRGVLKIPKRATVSYPNKPKALDTSATQDQLNAVAEGATYSPSPYHCPDSKGRLASRLKPAMPCAEGWSTQDALNALRVGIRGGKVSKAWIGKFPRYDWHRAGDIWYEAQTNTGTAGRYHAYPIEDSGVPLGLKGKFFPLGLR
jgi:hypothetical protein